MFMPQSLREYLDNPMGKGSTAILNRQLIKDDLNNRYKKLLDKKKFIYTIYQDGHDYFFHFLIPSESERDNTYDVVIQFTMGEDNFMSDVNLNRYYLKFFSNCPSFVYTFTYVYNDYDLLIDFLKTKYTDKVLEDNPVVRNPGEIISYEKSVYFACKYLDDHKLLLNKISLSTQIKKHPKKTLLAEVRESDKIMLEIKKEEKRLKDEKEKKKNDLSKKDKPNNNKIAGTKRTGINVVKPSKKITAKKKIGKRNK